MLIKMLTYCVYTASSFKNATKNNIFLLSLSNIQENFLRFKHSHVERLAKPTSNNVEGAGDDRQVLRLLFNVGAWERVYRNDMRLTFPVKLMFLLLIIYFGDLHCQTLYCKSTS